MKLAELLFITANVAQASRARLRRSRPVLHVVEDAVSDEEDKLDERSQLEDLIFWGRLLDDSSVTTSSATPEKVSEFTSDGVESGEDPETVPEIEQDDTIVVEVSPEVYQLSEALVTQALSGCAANTESRVFRTLVDELARATTTDTNDFLIFPPLFEEGYLQERFALGILFEETGGATEWTNSTGWKVPGVDPCTAGWYGVASCNDREHGECAITSINLSSNNLVGVIPEELCCLPCLESLDLSGNALTGATPSCVADWQPDAGRI